MTILPNSFQSPNDYVDAAMELLTGDEYKCLSFAARHILGWQDKINRRRGHISISMFEHGYDYATEEGEAKHLGGTGLSRPTIVKIVATLVKFGFLIPVGEPTAEGQEYQLGQKVDWRALQDRQAQKAAKEAQRTRKARAALQARREAKKQPVVNGTNQDEVVNGTNQDWLMGQTTAGLSDKLNQSHIKANQNQELLSSDDESNQPPGPETEKEPPLTHQQLIGIVSKAFNNTNYGYVGKLKKYLTAAVTPQDGAYYQWRIEAPMTGAEILAYRLWREDEERPMPSVAETLQRTIEEFRGLPDYTDYMARGQMELNALFFETHQAEADSAAPETAPAQADDPPPDPAQAQTVFEQLAQKLRG